MSTIQEIIDEITEKLKAIPDSVAYAWDVPRIATTPAVLVGLPERVGYRTAYNGRGKTINLTVVVLVGMANARSSQKNLLKLMETTGAQSLFRLADSQFTSYTTCDDVTVVDCEPDVFRNAGNDYLGAEFSINVTATGA